MRPTNKPVGLRTHASIVGGLALALMFGPACASIPAVDCRHTEFGLQVLGSGGPAPDVGRASSGYLVWVDGQARVLVDAGGGTFARFAEASASLDALQLIALSHLHADHSADLPAFIKGSFFGGRRDDLPIVGPSSGGPFPGLSSFLNTLFGTDGAYAYLSWVLDPDQGNYTLVIQEVDSHTPVVVLDAEVRVSAVKVEHGPVPALGFRVDYGGHSIAFGGDQNANNPAFTDLATGVDLLIVHHAIADDKDSVAHALHRSPTEIVELVSATKPNTVLLSHHMARSITQADKTKATIEAQTDSAALVAEDLICVPVGG